MEGHDLYLESRCKLLSRQDAGLQGRLDTEVLFQENMANIRKTFEVDTNEEPETFDA